MRWILTHLPGPTRAWLLPLPWLVATACTYDAAPTDAHESEPDMAWLEPPDVFGAELRDPAQIFFCGNDRCDPGENETTCVDDCGALVGSYKTQVRPRLRLWGEPASPTLACASPDRDGWRFGGLPHDTPLPYSTFVSDCSLDPFYAGEPDRYTGSSAHWLFVVPRPGRFQIEAWIPAPAYACVQHVFVSQRVTYFLFGPTGLLASVDIAQAETMGGMVSLFDALSLEAGTHTLYLPDNAASGCSCGPTAECPTGLQMKRLYADTITITRL